MSIAPYGPLPEPTHNVIRSCRDVIDTAGQVTMALAGDPAAAVRALERENPAAAGPFAALLDAVMTLDHRTGFLAPIVPAHLHG